MVVVVVKEVFTVVQPEDHLETENSLNLLIVVKDKEDHTATEQSVNQGILAIQIAHNARLSVHNAIANSDPPTTQRMISGGITVRIHAPSTPARK